MLLGATICHMSTRKALDIALIARRVADRRTELRLEQTELAEKANLSRAYISRLEGGTVPNPKLFDLQRVADALDMTMVELVAPDTHIATARFSHDLAELQQQLEGLPEPIREMALRSIRESVDVIHEASGLARRN